MIPLIIFIAYFIALPIVVYRLKRKGIFLWEVLPNDEVWEIPMIGKTDD